MYYYSIYRVQSTEEVWSHDKSTLPDTQQVILTSVYRSKSNQYPEE